MKKLNSEERPRRLPQQFIEKGNVEIMARVTIDRENHIAGCNSRLAGGTVMENADDH